MGGPRWVSLGARGAHQSRRLQNADTTLTRLCDCVGVMNQRNLSLASLPAEARQNLFINRELSWLKFNERVLGEAARDDVPLCERLSFLSIFQTNLDEFFKVRIGALVDRLQLGGEPDEKTGLSVAEQLAAARSEVQRLSAFRAEVWGHLREPLQREAAPEIVPANQWSAQDKDAARTIFREQMADTLSVLLLGKHRSPPFLRTAKPTSPCSSDAAEMPRRKPAWASSPVPFPPCPDSSPCPGKAASRSQKRSSASAPPTPSRTAPCARQLSSG